MNKTLKISFSLRNTYRVNGILYALKQIPLIKKLLPDVLYQIRGLKIFANVLSVLWELVSVFLGKLLYLLIMVCGMGSLYKNLPQDQVFLHIFLLLTIIGGFVNTHLFNPSKDKYYAIVLMRMNAREYTLVNYTYAILKVIVGFLPFTLWLGISWGRPVWLCVLLPFSVAGFKLLVAALSLWDYERRGFPDNENKLNKYLWLAVGVLLSAAYGLPALGIVLPAGVPVVLLLVFILCGAVCMHKIYTFKEYREINQELLAQTINQMDTAVQLVKAANEKKITEDSSITSSRKGFEYFNELFIKRHRKILWNSTRKIAYVCTFIVGGAALFLYLKPEVRPAANEMIMTRLPYFAFILYAINRGTGFTQALFMNCDHSMLTYSFYKQPKYILKLFRIRLREIMKINAVPALIIGTGLALLLYVSGGTADPLNYVILVVSVLCMSLFFSVHYLVVYYLLQPYNAGTEMKSGMYQVIMSVTYIFCFYLMRLRMPALVFGIMTIVFCVGYSLTACILVYKLAPRTFKLRV